MEFVDSGVTGTYGADSESVSGALSNTLAHARRMRRGHAHTVDGGCARDHPPCTRDRAMSMNTTESPSRRAPLVRQPSRSPSKGRTPPQTDPRAPPCERSCNRRAACPGTEYAPPWVEMERPSQPNVAHVDGSWMRARVRQLRRKENAVHEVAPSCAPASWPPAPAERALDTQRRREATAPTMPRQQGRVASHPLTTGWPPAPPPFTRIDGQSPPEQSRASRPTCHRVRTAEAVLSVVPARPYSVPVQRLGVATRRWLGSTTALCAKPST